MEHSTIARERPRTSTILGAASHNCETRYENTLNVNEILVFSKWLLLGMVFKRGTMQSNPYVFIWPVKSAVRIYHTQTNNVRSLLNCSTMLTFSWQVQNTINNVVFPVQLSKNAARIFPANVKFPNFSFHVLSGALLHYMTKSSLTSGIPGIFKRMTQDKFILCESTQIDLKLNFHNSFRQGKQVMNCNTSKFWKNLAGLGA